MADQDYVLPESNPVLFYVLGVLYFVTFALTFYYVATASPFL